jgi:hypothetical protein
MCRSVSVMISILVLGNQQARCTLTPADCGALQQLSHLPQGGQQNVPLSLGGLQPTGTYLSLKKPQGDKNKKS